MARPSIRNGLEQLPQTGASLAEVKALLRTYEDAGTRARGETLDKRRPSPSRFMM
jgi:hypothetical protein